MTPPPLAWLDGLIHSLTGATGLQVSYTTRATVNPLVVQVRILFGERVSGTNMMLAWNLFQMYASKNDCVLQGKSANAEGVLLAEAIMKRRLGPPRDDHPLKGFRP